MSQLSKFPLLAMKSHSGKGEKPRKVRFRVLRESVKKKVIIYNVSIMKYF